jgi:hypothetical protein
VETIDLTRDRLLQGEPLLMLELVLAGSAAGELEAPLSPTATTQLCFGIMLREEGRRWPRR